MPSRLSVLYDEDIKERVFVLQGLNEHHNYSFEFYGDSVIQKNQTANVTARLLDDGVPLAGEEISFLLNSNTTTAITDSFGESSISYTGSGVGQVPIQVSYRTFLQETYELWDCTKFDNATTNSHNDIWNNDTENLERKSEYSTLKESTTDTTVRLYTGISNECTILLDFYQVDGQTNSQILTLTNSSNSNRASITLNNLSASIGTWVTVKIELTTTQAVVTNMGTGVSVTKTISNTDVSRFNIATYNTATELQFRNFKVYSA